MTRVLDVLLSFLGLVMGAPIFVVLWILGWLDTGSPLFRQERVGRHQKPFTLVKFRTMRPDTASVATHLADASAVTQLGQFLRRSKLDELPQLWNVLKGEMSLVGPRPCLFSQTELIDERESRRGRIRSAQSAAAWRDLPPKFGGTVRCRWSRPRPSARSTVEAVHPA